jgi:methyl-accepting chemotaxis protein
LFALLGLDTQQVDDAIQTHKELNAKFLTALKQYDVKNPNSVHIVDALVRGVDRPTSQKIDDIVAYIRNQSTKMLDASNRKSEFVYQAGEWTLLVMVLLAMVAGMIFTFVIMRTLLKQLGGEPDYAADIASRIATGDLTVAIHTKANDQTSMLVAMKAMRDSLANIVGEFRMGTESIASASAQIAAGNLDLSNRTESQASSLEETASAMEQLTSTVKQNADNARQANQLAETASQVASKGGAVVSDVVNTMSEINDSARKIADIIGVIDGIAFQTNILALNAAVEAARAGEQGRGFAVVATEVRSLAQRSAAAAKEIKLLIDDSVNKVEQGTKQASQAGATMREVVSSVQRVTDIMSEISAASREQSQGIEEVNLAITQMDETTQQNAALVEQAAAAAKSLQDQAGHLEELVNQFQLDGVRRTTPSAHAAMKTVQGSRVQKRPAQVAHQPVMRASKGITTKSTNETEWEEF